MSNTVPVILVVEDDIGSRSIVTFMLEDAGYHVLEASSADQALSLLQVNEDVDLVFSDIQMPGHLSGIELACRLHREKLGLPVILTSAKPADHYENYPDQTPFLEKPYGRLSLLEEIAKGLGQAAH